MNEVPVEYFPALQQTASCCHAFVRRVAGIEVSHDKVKALQRLDHVHRTVRDSLGLGASSFLTAEQVHGNLVEVIDRPSNSDRCLADCDGLITNQKNICLGIYVADCCAVFLVDPVRHCIGLVHSGKKGTALAITAKAITKLQEQFGSEPNDLIVQLGPCIRPPHYETDFAAEIVAQARAAGVKQVHDCGICTACDLSHYYSYRAEKGRTGRMLALLAII